MKPPVEAPTSRHSRPSTGMTKHSSARSSFSPPRETKRGRSATAISTSRDTSVPGFDARAPSAPSVTSPAITAAAARLRLSKSPRSTISVSSRILSLMA